MLYSFPQEFLGWNVGQICLVIPGTYLFSSILLFVFLWSFCGYVSFLQSRRCGRNDSHRGRTTLSHSYFRLSYLFGAQIVVLLLLQVLQGGCFHSPHLSSLSRSCKAIAGYNLIFLHCEQYLRWIGLRSARHFSQSTVRSPSGERGKFTDNSFFTQGPNH